MVLVPPSEDDLGPMQLGTSVSPADLWSSNLSEVSPLEPVNPGDLWSLDLNEVSHPEPLNSLPTNNLLADPGIAFELDAQQEGGDNPEASPEHSTLEQGPPPQDTGVNMAGVESEPESNAGFEEDDEPGSLAQKLASITRHKLSSMSNIQVPRSRAPTKIPKAARDMIAAKKRDRAERLKADIKKLRENLEADAEVVADQFDITVEQVIAKFENDTRWTTKKRAPNLWNAVVHARSEIMNDGKKIKADTWQ
jgi:hypothetical protein